MSSRIDHQDAAEIARIIRVHGYYGEPLRNLAKAYLELAADRDADQEFRDDRLAERRRLNNSPSSETT